MWFESYKNTYISGYKQMVRTFESKYYFVSIHTISFWAKNDISYGLTYFHIKIYMSFIHLHTSHNSGC